HRSYEFPARATRCDRAYQFHNKKTVCRHLWASPGEFPGNVWRPFPCRGGGAGLSLLDENDPLNCGIEITAKPPGKQLQSVSLLSGGERAMTAVALLFEFFLVRPSPFCILDEVDAPLDESNINRFTRMLDRFVQ